MRVAFGRKKEKTSEKATLFKLVLKMSKSAIFSLVQVTGLEPAWVAPLEPESSASANSAILAYIV